MDSVSCSGWMQVDHVNTFTHKGIFSIGNFNRGIKERNRGSKINQETKKMKGTDKPIARSFHGLILNDIDQP